MRITFTFLLYLLGVSITQACPDGQHQQCWLLCGCVPDGPNVGNLIPDEIKPSVILSGGMSLIWEEAKRQNIPVLSQVAVNMDALTQNVENELRTAVGNTLNAQDKAIRDAASNVLKSANDVTDATRAVGHYAEREVAGWGRTLTSAEERLREGKIVDALWHDTTDPWQESNMNAAQLAQENELARTAMSSAAAVYGGPAGAAAFAAWQTYMSSDGNMDLALRAGVLSYATSVAGGSVNGMQASTLGEAAKKAAMAGAIGGLAVAASGGSDEAALNAFVQSGGAVLIQTGRDYVKDTITDPGMTHLQENYVNPMRAKLDAFCVTATGENCETVAHWYNRSREKIAELEKLTQSKPTLIVSGDWAISWDPYMIAKPGENEPAVVMTFVGAGSPIRSALVEVAALTAPPSVPVGNMRWVAYRDIGDETSFFYNLSIGLMPGEDPTRGKPKVGDRLIATTDLNIRSAPADWTAVDMQLGDGDEILVLGVETLTVEGTEQEWVQFAIDNVVWRSKIDGKG